MHQWCEILLLRFKSVQVVSLISPAPYSLAEYAQISENSCCRVLLTLERNPVVEELQFI